MDVSIYGAGLVAGNVSRLLRKRTGYRVAGPFGRLQRREALSSGADIVVIVTTSFLDEIAPDIRMAVNSGSNVLTSAEECAFPWAVDDQLAVELADLARSNGVTVVGAGLNPGFAFDALVLTMLGTTWDVDRIRVERVVDLSGFGNTVLRRLGLGWKPGEFDSKVISGEITGHIGFPQSMHIVASKLGLTLNRVDRRLKPIVGNRFYGGKSLNVEDGQIAGFEQEYVGYVDDRPWFEAIFTGHIALDAIEQEARDEIFISGMPPVHVATVPGMNPQVASAAILANSLQRVVSAEAGWLTVADLPPAIPANRAG